MEKEYLSDSFAVTGRDFAGFKKHIKKLSEATDFLTLKSDQIKLLALCTIEKAQKDGMLVFWEITRDSLDAYTILGEHFPLRSIPMEVFGEELCQEMKEGPGLVLLDGEKEPCHKYIISENAMKTLGQRAGIAGESVAARDNLFRNLFLADALIGKKDWIDFVYRFSDDGVSKIFAAFSDEYNLNVQSLLLDVLEQPSFPFPRRAVRSYRINHNISEVYMDLPAQCPNIIPGLVVTNSDTGNSSFVVRTVIRLGDGYAILSENLVRHDSGFSIEKIEEAFNEAKGHYDRTLVRFAENLEALKNESAADYDEFDPMSELDRGKNYRTIVGILKSGANYLYRKYLSKKQMLEFERCLAESIDAGKQYTKYDIAVLLFGIVERVPIESEATKVGLRRDASRILEMFQLSGKRSDSEKVEIVSVPEEVIPD